MDLIKLQNLLNECIMIEQGNYLGGNFSVDLSEAQAELDQAKQLLINGVSQQRELLYAVCDELEKVNKQPIPPSLKSLVVNKVLADNCG